MHRTLLRSILLNPSQFPPSHHGLNRRGLSTATRSGTCSARSGEHEDSEMFKISVSHVDTSMPHRAMDEF